MISIDHIESSLKLSLPICYLQVFLGDEILFYRAFFDNFLSSNLDINMKDRILALEEFDTKLHMCLGTFSYQ